MKKNRRWWILPSSLLLAAATFVAFEAVAGKGDASPLRVTVTVTGLPADAEVHVWEVTTNMEQSELERTTYVGSLAEGQTRSFSVTQPILEIGEHFQSGAGMFRPSHRYFHLGAAANHVQVRYTPFHFLNTDVQIRVAHLRDVPEVLPDPPSADEYYEHGSIVHASAAMPPDLRLGYWQILTSGASLVEAEVIPGNLAAQAQLRLEMNRSLIVTGVFVDPWSRQARKPEVSGITITNLSEGQIVRLIDGDRPVAEARVDAEAIHVLVQPPGSGPWQGYFEVTGPDGRTPVFQSPRYEDLLPGDEFAF